jgi:hypothetical protein
MPLKCDPARKIVDDSGFPRTPDRLLKFCGTRVQWLKVFKTITGTCGPYYLGGSATHVGSTHAVISTIAPGPIPLDAGWGVQAHATVSHTSNLYPLMQHTEQNINIFHIRSCTVSPNTFFSKIQSHSKIQCNHHPATLLKWASLGILAGYMQCILCWSTRYSLAKSLRICSYQQLNAFTGLLNL